MQGGGQGNHCKLLSIICSSQQRNSRNFNFLGISQVLCAFSGHAQPSGALICWLLQGKGMLLATQPDKPADGRLWKPVPAPAGCQRLSAALEFLTENLSQSSTQTRASRRLRDFSSPKGRQERDALPCKHSLPNTAYVVASAGRRLSAPSRRLHPSWQGHLGKGQTEQLCCPFCCDSKGFMPLFHKSHLRILFC